MEADIRLYDILATSLIGLFLFPIGISQIRLEKPSYGMIGYTFHRVYTSVGFLQLCTTIRLLDYDGETMRIITQWFLDLQSMLSILAILILSAYIHILSKNVVSNTATTHWHQLEKIPRMIHSGLIGLVALCSNLSSLLRIWYRYEFWTVLILLSNMICLSYTTLSLHYHLHYFLKHTEVVLSHMNNRRLVSTLKYMYMLRMMYTILMIPVFYFLGYYSVHILTTDSYHLNDFNNTISYLRYIILLGSLVMCWFSYIRPENVRVSPIIRPYSDASAASRMQGVQSMQSMQSMQSVFVLK